MHRHARLSTSLKVSGSHAQHRAEAGQGLVWCSASRNQTRLLPMMPSACKVEVCNGRLLTRHAIHMHALGGSLNGRNAAKFATVAPRPVRSSASAVQTVRLLRRTYAMLEQSRYRPRAAISRHAPGRRARGVHAQPTVGAGSRLARSSARQLVALV